MKVYSFTPITPLAIYAVVRTILAVVSVRGADTQKDVLISAANITDAAGVAKATHDHIVSVVWQFAEVAGFSLVLDILHDILMSRSIVQIARFESAIYKTYQAYWIRHVSSSVEDLGIMKYAGQYVGVTFAVVDLLCVTGSNVKRFGPEHPRLMLAMLAGAPVLIYGLIRLVCAISKVSETMRTRLREMDDRIRLAHMRERNERLWDFAVTQLLRLERDWIGAQLTVLCTLPWLLVRCLACAGFGVVGLAALGADSATARANYMSFAANGLVIFTLMGSLGRALHSYAKWRSEGVEFESAMEKLEEHPRAMEVVAGSAGLYGAGGILTIARLESKPIGGFALRAEPIEIRPGLTVVGGPSGGGKSSLNRLFSGTMDEGSLDLSLGAGMLSGTAAMNAIARDARVMEQKSADALLPHVPVSVEAFYGEHVGMAMEILREFDMGKFVLAGAKFSVKKMSGGEQNRAVIVRVICEAIAARVGLVVLDEADAPLDKKCCARFVHILEKWLVGKRVVIVSHTEETVALIKASALFGGAYEVAEGVVTRE
jgi:ABC-type dipeptide/oligopeptide/nickel transport system ATPase subunit